MNLRAATLPDLPDIVETYNSTVPGRTVTADTEPVTVESCLPWFHEHDPESRPTWVAEVEGEVEGEITGWFSFEPFRKQSAYHAPVEVSIYIAAKHRRREIAKRLFAEAIRHAPAPGLKTLTAGAFAHNEPSLIQFEHFGLEPWAYFPRVAELDEEPVLG